MESLMRLIITLGHLFSTEEGYLIVPQVKQPKFSQSVDFTQSLSSNRTSGILYRSKSFWEYPTYFFASRGGPPNERDSRLFWGRWYWTEGDWEKYKWTKETGRIVIVPKPTLTRIHLWHSTEELLGNILSHKGEEQIHGILKVGWFLWGTRFDEFYWYLFLLGEGVCCGAVVGFGF